MCVLSIKVPLGKKSGNLFNEPCRLLFLCFLMRKWVCIESTHTKSKKEHKIKKNTFKCIYSIMKYFNQKVVNKCLSLCLVTVKTQIMSQFLEPRNIVQGFMAVILYSLFLNKYY